VPVPDQGPSAAAAERLLRATVRHSPLATATLDPQGRVLDANPALCHLLDRGADQLVGHDLAAFARVAPRDAADGDPPDGDPPDGDIPDGDVPDGDLPDADTQPADLLARLRDGADVVEALTRYVRPAADTVWVRLTAIAVRDDDGRLAQVVAQLADVTEQQLAVQMLAHQNGHDALTGLPNRTLGLDTLQTELDRRGGVAVLCVDLDRFKAVNDSIGPARGDEVLGEVARRLQRAVRPGDTVARLAGDEFVVVCGGLEPGREAEQLAGLAERLLAEVREPVAVEGRVVVPSVSIGAAVSSPDDLPLGLLRDAGAALRQAKANGPGSWVLTDDSMRRRTLDELDIEDALRTGVAQGELRLHLQPIVDLVTEEVVGREALVRWQHPERGLLAPAGFLPVAEESGLIQDLGRWVLEEAARIAAAAPDLGYVAVNVSPAQVRRASLLHDVRHTLDVTGLDPTRLVLELTESMMLGAATDGRRQLRELDAIGVRTVVDDFGTGFAALSHLRELPVSGIKVDRTFTAGLGTDPRCDRIVEALTGLARGLGVDLVAEGVETETQRSVLEGIGCAHAQGFLFGQPRPAREILPHGHGANAQSAA